MKQSVSKLKFKLSPLIAWKIVTIFSKSRSRSRSKRSSVETLLRASVRWNAGKYRLSKYSCVSIAVLSDELQCVVQKHCFSLFLQFFSIFRRILSLAKRNKAFMGLCITEIQYSTLIFLTVPIYLACKIGVYKILLPSCIKLNIIWYLVTSLRFLVLSHPNIT